ncbi:MAG: hypothetical protein HN802_02780 [Candidatus Jacksonbacteria bacterium]|jgi:hypothetical protein|nr:hypothetical protein [Candidatus Jacksonbacteria bacterium]
MQRIPKIIHQTYGTRNLPTELRRTVDTLKAMNSEYTYIFYDDLDIIHFIENNYPKDVLTLFNMINPKYGAARADLFRYLVIYKMGGVYLDIKSCTSIPLRNIIKKEDSYILSHWISRDWADEIGNPKGEYQQWHIIAEASHIFLSQVLINVFNNIANYDINKDGVGKLATTKITGPRAYSKSIFSIIDEGHPHRIENTEGEIGLQYYGTSYNLSNLDIHYSKQTEPLIL